VSVRPKFSFTRTIYGFLVHIHGLRIYVSLFIIFICSTVARTALSRRPVITFTDSRYDPIAPSSIIYSVCAETSLIQRVIVHANCHKTKNFILFLLLLVYFKLCPSLHQSSPVRALQLPLLLKIHVER